MKTTGMVVVAAFAASPGVANASPDYQVRMAWIPNDPLFANQWYLHNTGQQGGTPGADIGALRDVRAVYLAGARVA